jgi:calcineurin-like phosphoesterase family protein
MRTTSCTAITHRRFAARTLSLVFMHITHFTSDPHYGHNNIIGFSSRPFFDTLEMNTVLITEYNRHVGANDTVLWVGDCFFCSKKEATEILAQLNGHKILVRGNHDASAAAMARIGFDLVMDSLTMHLAGKVVRVHHYPYRSEAYRDDYKRVEPAGLKWPERHKDEWLIHGHIHSLEKQNGHAIHVGVDAWNFRPASLAEIEQLIGGAS